MNTTQTKAAGTPDLAGTRGNKRGVAAPRSRQRTANGRGKARSVTVRSVTVRLVAALLPGALAVVCGCGKPAPGRASDEPPVLARPAALNDAGQVVGGIHAPNSRLPAFRYDSRRDTGASDPDGNENPALDTLPVPPGMAWVCPNGLNAQGDIVGFAARADDGTRHAAVWQNGVCRLLDDAGAQSSEATAINGRGEIVGVALAATGARRGLRWRAPYSAPPDDIAALTRMQARPTGINDRGEVVGWRRDAQNRDRLFVLRNGTLHDLGPGLQIALSSRGQMAGAYINAQGRVRACVWDHDIGRNTPAQASGARMQDASGTPDANIGDPSANDADTGRRNPTYAMSERRNLPLPPGMNESAALALNDRGQIAGRVQGQAGSPPFAALWEDGRVRDLNAALPAGVSYTLEEAVGINSAGQIVCAARDKKDFRGRCALLTPVGKDWHIRVFP